MNPPIIKCPKHRTGIDANRPFCHECRFPLQCPTHRQYVDINNRCEVCGRPRDERTPREPNARPNRCFAHMIESGRNGNCGCCGRPANDPFGPARPNYAAVMEHWKETVRKAEESLAAAM